MDHYGLIIIMGFPPGDPLTITHVRLREILNVLCNDEKVQGGSIVGSMLLMPLAAIYVSLCIIACMMSVSGPLKRAAHAQGASSHVQIR